MKQHNLFYGSSYDRCLQILLGLWPKIIEKYSDAELHICYGWQTFDAMFTDNPERQMWKQRINEMMNQKGIIHHGRLGKTELQEVRKSCGIWAYPTFFQEINCITALECQRDGLTPVTINDFALKETVGSGIKVDGDIYDKDIQEKWLEALFSIMGDLKKWTVESIKAYDFAKNYSWDKIAKEWEQYL